MNAVLENKINFHHVEESFNNKVAKNPYCTDNLNFGLQIRSKKIALGKKYIQPNTPFNFSWFCFDIDYPYILETTFKESFIPAPNIMITNPENNHCHLLYGIRDQIHLNDNSSIEPIRYARFVEYALGDLLKADKGYSGLIIKNPNHNDWITTEINPNLWSLGEINDFLILPYKIPQREILFGLGRNCTLFDNGRHFAYSQVLNYRNTSNKENFYQAVLSFLNDQNRMFNIPLSYHEFKAIAKSITNWTWRYYGNKTTKQWIAYVKRTHNVDIQSWRGKRNTSEQQSIKGKLNTSEQQSIKGKLNSVEIQAIKGRLNTFMAQSLKGKLNTSEQQSIKGKLNSVEIQSIKGKLNTSEAQAIKGKLNISESQSIKGKLNTSEAQSLKGKLNTSEAQAIKGKLNTSEAQAIKGKLNTSEAQAIKGKLNTSETQAIKGIKSGEIRFEGSKEQLKPWEILNISRRTYYYRQKNNLI